MEVAAVLLVVFGHVYARPEFGGTDRRYETSQDVHAQQLGVESDSAALPYSVQSSGQVQDNFDGKYFEGAMIPVRLVYEPVQGPSETQAVVRQVSLENLTGMKRPQLRISTRTSRSHEFPDDLAVSNDIPSADFRTNSENPTPEMYNDNFGGEHDSQDGMIPEEVLRNQHHGFDADAYNRALGIEARTANKGASPSESSVPLSSLNHNVESDPISASDRGVVRRIQHYQTVFAPPIFHAQPKPVEPYGNNESPRVLWSDYPYLASRMSPNHLMPGALQGRLSGGYLPSFVDYNPVRSVWSAYTSVVEYGPNGEPCETDKSRKKREAFVKEQKKRRETEEDVMPEEFKQILLQEDMKDPKVIYQKLFGEDFFRSSDGGPRIMRLKVRRGGVAIAGPGGIATAGSGGTAIVGPGGTAYTTQDGTAVVGPGGRVIEIPYHTTKIEARATDPYDFFIPPGGRILGTGPFIYYGKNHASMTVPPVIERL